MNLLIYNQQEIYNYCFSVIQIYYRLWESTTQRLEVSTRSPQICPNVFIMKNMNNSSQISVQVSFACRSLLFYCPTCALCQSKCKHRGQQMDHKPEQIFTGSQFCTLQLAKTPAVALILFHRLLQWSQSVPT